MKKKLHTQCCIKHRRHLKLNNGFLLQGRTYPKKALLFLKSLAIILACLKILLFTQVVLGDSKTERPVLKTNAALQSPGDFQGLRDSDRPWNPKQAVLDDGMNKEKKPSIRFSKAHDPCKDRPFKFNPLTRVKSNDLLLEARSGFHKDPAFFLPIPDTWPPLLKFQIHRLTPEGKIKIDVKGPWGRSIGNIEGRLSSLPNPAFKGLSQKMALHLLQSNLNFSLYSVFSGLQGMEIIQEEYFDVTNFFHPKLILNPNINLNIMGTYRGAPITFFCYDGMFSFLSKLRSGDRILNIKTDGWYGPEFLSITSDKDKMELYKIKGLTAPKPPSSKARRIRW